MPMGDMRVATRIGKKVIAVTGWRQCSIQLINIYNSRTIKEIKSKFSTHHHYVYHNGVHFLFNSGSFEIFVNDELHSTVEFRVKEFQKYLTNVSLNIFNAVIQQKGYLYCMSQDDKLVRFKISNLLSGNTSKEQLHSDVFLFCMLDGLPLIANQKDSVINYDGKSNQTLKYRLAFTGPRQELKRIHLFGGK